jgi:hypothetical protein
MPSWGAVPERLWLSVATLLAVLLASPGAWNPSAIAAAVKQRHFASAEAGVQALIDALKAGHTKALLTVLGPGARPLVVSGDRGG